MGHHQNDKEPKPVQNAEISPHPWLEKNDIVYLSMVKPLLSDKAQKLVGLLIDVGNPASIGNLDIQSMLKGLTAKGEGNQIQEILPLLLGMFTSGTEPGKLNPALLANLLSTLNQKSTEK